MSRLPYIKPTQFKHDSGFRTFEVGYCDIDTNNRATNIKAIGNYCDHVNQDYMMLVGNLRPFCINIDLTVNGYIRLFILDAKGKELCWDSEWPASTMTLTIRDKTDDNLA